MEKHSKIGIVWLLSGLFTMSVTHAETDRTGFTYSVEDSIITALGIEKDPKTLPYHVQKVEGAELTKVKDANFVNSLIGRVAGATINASSSGAGGSVRVIMRGLRSISGNNEVMYVLDGIPLPQLSSEQSNDIYSGMGQSGDGISAINPDDIESVSVLTGAAASVLYGSDAANGVIMITTKKGQAGKLSVNVSNSTTFSSPLVMPKFQNSYSGWGDKLDTPTNWNPSDFFQTGHTINNSISLSFGSKKNQTYFSAATQNSQGIIPNNDVDRYHFSFRNTSSLLKDRLKLDLNFRYTNTNEQNMLSQGQSLNPLVPVYLIPNVVLPKDEGTISGIPIENFYERYDPSLGHPTQYWPVGDLGMDMQNPYWTINRDIFNNKKNRILTGLRAAFNITDWLNVSARIQYDRDDEERNEKYYASTLPQFAGPLGSYAQNEVNATQFYSNVMLNANKHIGDFSINATLGGSIRDMRYDHSIQRGHLQVANQFAVSNLDMKSSLTHSVDYHNQTKSTFAAAQLGYKNRLYLDIAGRMDWLNFWDEKDIDTSTEIFYPSVGLSIIPTEWLATKSDILSFMKLRYSYSQSGNSLQYYVPTSKSLYPTMEKESISGDLRPERTKSHEMGLDASLWGNKINLSFTMYKASTSDLLFRAILPTENRETYFDNNYAARVDNKGIELTLGLNQYLGPVKWTSHLTYSINKNEIKHLMDNVSQPATGEKISLEYLSVFNNKGVQMRLSKGGSIGDIYVTTLKKDEQGNTVVDPHIHTVIPAENYIYAGNTNPDYTLGWVNNFTWKGVELGFVIHARIGGVGVSLTEAAMDRFGVSKASSVARDNGGVWVGDEQIPANQYYAIVAGYDIGSEYTYDMTNIRLAEMSIGYNIPVNKWVKWIQGVHVSLIGRNLLMLYNKAPFDPESVASTNTYYQGIDFFQQPSLRSMGFSVNLKF